jgi:hypothetical protein
MTDPTELSKEQALRLVAEVLDLCAYGLVYDDVSARVQATGVKRILAALVEPPEGDIDGTLLGCVYQAPRPFPEGGTGEATVTGFERVVRFTTTFNGAVIALKRSEDSFKATYPKIKGPKP